MNHIKTVEPYKTTLHGGNAYWMAKLSQAVYLETHADDQTPDEENMLANLQAQDQGFISVCGFNKNSAQAVVIEHQDYLCMAFTGTNELADWLDNLNAFSTKVLFGECHRGFWRCVEDVWSPMFAHVLDLESQVKRPVFITGHSLGGAMATIAAAKFVHQDKPFTSVYTFGQPRALARETARMFDVECRARFFRFQNNNDLVTRAPSRLMGYSHVGSYLYISEEQEIHADPGFWFKFLDRVDGAVDDLRERGVDGLKDHKIEEYLRAIDAWKLK